MHSPNISRRSLAAGLALAPVAGLPALAGAVSVDDPVFAALAEFQRLQAVEKAAEKGSSEVSEAFCAARDALGVVTFKGEKVYSLKHLEFLADRPRPMSEAELEAAIANLR